MIIYKSPLNGAFPHSNGGGRFSHFLRSSGYDHLVITGRSDKPVYVKIHDDDVELCEARDLWGRDTFETTDELRKRHEPCSIIPIGQAGENLVPISVTFIDKGGTVVCAGIHMSDIPSFPYDILWHERMVLSVANLTRKDAEEFLAIAPQVPVTTSTHLYPLERANDALADLRAGRFEGAAVLDVSG